MKYEIVNFEGMYVIGNGVRTTNAENKFGDVWQSFLSEYTGGQIVGLYTDYESDYKGVFTFAVGITADKCDKANSYRIPKGKYANFFINDKSKVFEVWQYIWGSDIDRTYAADFEKYHDDGSVDIYISVN